MKISEFEKVTAMLEARKSLREILSYANHSANLGEVSVDGHLSLETVHPEAMEHWRMAITESVRFIERDLLAAGIEIDEDAIKGVDTDDFVDQTYGRYRHLDNKIIQG